MLKPAEFVIRQTLLESASRLARPAYALVAFSGGLDSTVLLHALYALREQFQHLSAAHVHHGISDQAGAWLAFCQNFCKERKIPFLYRRILLKNEAQLSLEEEARNARYRSLLEMAKEAGAAHIVLAQHQDDQVESLMLQLLRGAGPHGLAAMAPNQPLPRHDDSVALWRPLLQIPRSTLAQYARENGLDWVDDDSNANIGFKRNFLRHKVFPIIEEAFPGYRKTLARAASLQADTVSLLDQHLLLQNPQNIAITFPIALNYFKQLPKNLAQQVLRQAIDRAGLRAPNYRHLLEMARQLQYARDDARIALNLGQYRVGIHKGNIHLYLPTAPYRMHWRRENMINLAHGRLELSFAKTPGLNRIILDNAQSVVVSSRKDKNETLKCLARPRRLLSDLFREAGIPHWARASWPRIYIDHELAAVPDIGVAEKYHSETDSMIARFLPESGIRKNRREDLFPQGNPS